jgi:hypothetical protein
MAITRVTVDGRKENFGSRAKTEKDVSISGKETKVHLIKVTLLRQTLTTPSILLNLLPFLSNTSQAICLILSVSTILQLWIN